MHEMLEERQSKDSIPDDSQSSGIDKAKYSASTSKEMTRARLEALIEQQEKLNRLYELPERPLLLHGYLSQTARGTELFPQCEVSEQDIPDPAGLFIASQSFGAQRRPHVFSVDAAPFVPRFKPER